MTSSDPSHSFRSGPATDEPAWVRYARGGPGWVRSSGARPADGFLITKAKIPKSTPELSQVAVPVTQFGVLPTPVTNSVSDYTERLVRILAGELRVPPDSIDSDALFADLAWTR